MKRTVGVPRTDPINLVRGDYLVPETLDQVLLPPPDRSRVHRRPVQARRPEAQIVICVPTVPASQVLKRRLKAASTTGVLLTRYGIRLGIRLERPNQRAF